MSIEENKAVIRHFLEAGNKQDLEAIGESLDPHCTISHLTRFGFFPTVEGYKPFLTSYFESLPDVHFTIEDVVAEGEKVWVRLNIRGTHNGLLRNIPATGKKVSYTQIGMYRVVNGKIVDMDVYNDDMHLLRQLDAFPTFEPKS
ncbi:MAG: ester cyclase [Candidatus Dormibacteraceae bacterium]